MSVYIAGDLETAKRWLRRHCHDVGLCVTVTPTTYIYRGGEESGIVVGLVNYPRFPTPPGDLDEQALTIARALIEELCQWSALVVTPETSAWISVRG